MRARDKFTTARAEAAAAEKEQAKAYDAWQDYYDSHMRG